MGDRQETLVDASRQLVLETHRFILNPGFNLTGTMQTYLTRFTRQVALLTLGTTLVFWACSGRGQTLGQALNAPTLAWTTSGTGGALGWSIESVSFLTHDGTNAARSFVGSSLQISTIQTTVIGPGKITFWWNDNSSSSTLSFTINGVLATNTYQWGIWRKETLFLGAGSQTLRWNNSGSTGGGTVYLDEVTYQPGNFAPEIVAQPLSQSQVVGLDAMFSVAAQGTAPLSYQWQFNGNDVLGATNQTLIISNIQSQVLGDYRVTITNGSGAITSSVATMSFGRVAAWGKIVDTGWATATNGLTNVVGIAAGAVHDLAISDDGSVLGWGLNPVGEISIPTSLTNGINVAAGVNSSASINPDGSLMIWGATFGATSVTNKPAGLTNIVQVALGTTHALALDAAGAVIAWGGPGPSAITNVPANLSNVVAVAAGGSSSLALSADGKVVAWGYNFSGLTNVPASATNAVAISAGSTHHLALLADGTVIAWGDNSFGATNVPSGLTNVVAIAAGNRFSLALNAAGTVVAWGNNTSGQTNVPLKLTNVVAIAAGMSHALALVGDGPPIAKTLMLKPQYSSQRFQVAIPSQCGRVYRLEYKTSLSDPSWTPLPLVAGQGKNLTLEDATAPKSGRFYRVCRW